MTLEKRIIDLDPMPTTIQDIDLFETSRDGTGSYFVSYSEIKLDLQDNLFTAGFGIDITAGIISSTFIPTSETLQIVYDNGVPGIKGTITLDPNDSFRLISTSAAFSPPSMTSSQFSSIVTKYDGMFCFSHDIERHVAYNSGGELYFAYLNDLDETYYAEMYFNDNILPTIITSIASPVKINATYQPGLLNLFTHSLGKLTYAGAPRKFQIIASLTCTLNLFPGNVSVFIYKNGVKVDKSKQSVYIGATTPADKPLSCQCMIDLLSGDYIEIYIQNDSATNEITVSQLNFMLSSMSLQI